MTSLILRHLVAAVAAGMTVLHAQDPPTGSAAWVVTQFFAAKSFPGEQAYVAPEFAPYAGRPTIGSTIRPSVRVSSRPVGGTDRVTFYATTVRDSSHVEEWYTQLRSDGGVWKIVTIRTVRMPPAFYATIDSLSHAMSPTAPPMLERMQLMIAPDSARAMYLRAHRAAFDSLATAMLSQSAVMAVDDAGASPTDDSSPVVRRMATSLRYLHLGAALRPPELAGCVVAKIGGVHDATRETSIGYLYAPPGCQPPAMGQPGYIYVESVAPRWYAFKYQVVSGG